MSPVAPKHSLLATSPRPEPVISALTNRPVYPLSIDRPAQEWLTDPDYSLESFLQCGGRQAIVELMREYVEIPGPYGIPAGLSYYKEFLGFRQRLTADERKAAGESWDRKRGGKAPSFEGVEDFLLSNADIHEKLSVLGDASRHVKSIWLDREDRKLREREKAQQLAHDNEVRKPEQEKARRAKGSQAGSDRARHELRLELQQVKAELERTRKERDQFKAERDKLQRALVRAVRDVKR